MKYYVISDTHGFYDETIQSLTNSGYFGDKNEKRLVLLGDLLDRGNQPNELVKFALSEMNDGKLIYIRGNHEDLMLDFIRDFNKNKWNFTFQTGHHWHNGTAQTALALTGMTHDQALLQSEKFVHLLESCDYIKKLIPKTLDYYETRKYIFTHGFIPIGMRWRSSTIGQWESARWSNGFDASKYNETGKSIIFGHWHTTWARAKYDGKSEFDADADFSPYTINGCIGIDACTAYSKTVNCLVLEDEE